MDLPADLIPELLRETKARLPFLAGALGVAAAAVALEARALRRLGPRLALAVHAAAVTAAIGVGLYLAWSVLWLCDDAYISFRYARNLAEGHGLVYNPGEWVEGYTNFLWTALLGVAGWVGLDIPLAALFGNLAAFAAALAATALAVRRSSPAPAVLPFAAVALAGSAAFTTFASSGLETMPLAALTAAALATSTLPRGAAATGLLLVAAALCRPDHVLLVPAMGAALVAEDLLHGEGPGLRRLRWRRLVAFAAPVLVVWVPYQLVRWRVYGDPFPNTYYAKSGDAAYWSQGFVYAVHFLGTTGAWAWLPAFVVLAVARVRDRNETRLRVFALLAWALLGTYVVRVGGDFMQHRFFLTLLPVTAVALETALRWRLADPARPAGLPVRLALAAVAVLALGPAVTHVEIVKPWEKRWHLSREETFYRVLTISPLRIESVYWDQQARLVRAFTANGVFPRLATGSTGILGYYTRLPIVDAFGLTNRRIARKPVRERGRPGHEKQAGLDELLAEGAEIDQGPLWGEDWAAQTRASVAGVDFTILQYVPATAQAMAKLPGARVPDPARDIRTLAASADRARVLMAVGLYERFLAPHPQRAQLMEPLRRRLGEVADFERRLPDGASASGNCKVESGAPPAGASGLGWLACRGNEPSGTGRVQIPLGRLAPDQELRFVLGGPASEALSVRLIVDGWLALEAHPAGGASLVPVAWDLSELAGRIATVEIADEDLARGAELLVDSIHLPGPGDVRQRLAQPPKDLPGRAELVREAERTLSADDPRLAEARAALPLRWTFDEALPEGTVVTGDAFGPGPVPGPLPHQGPIRGRQGAALLDSYHGADKGTGRVELPPVVLRGPRVSVLVGGGSDCLKTWVGVEIGKALVARACGRNDERLRPAVLDVARWVGREAKVVVVDQSADAWGHLLVDDVVLDGEGAGASASGGAVSR